MSAARLAAPCPACAGALEPQHCGRCHALFAQCGGCDARYAPLTRFPAEALPGPEHPACPRCETGAAVRPATRSDFEVRGWLGWLAP